MGRTDVPPCFRFGVCGVVEMDLLTVLMFLVVLGILCTIVVLVIIYMTSYPSNVTRHEDEKLFLDPASGKKEKFPNLGDSPSVDLSVVVPAYNEEERMPSMLDEALKYLEERQKQKSDFTYEVIVVDDGSSDKTTEVALKYAERYSTDKVRVLTLTQNRGKGGAVRMGMLSCRGKLLLFADADGATKFSDVQKLETQMRNIYRSKGQPAMVCGSRAHLEKDSIAQRSVFRTFLMLGFHFLVYFVCGLRGIRDTQCGFKLLTRSAAQLIFYNLHVDRWAFDIDMLYIANHFKMALAEVAVNWQEIEGSKLTPLWSSLQMGKDLLMVRLRYMTGGWTISEKVKMQ